MIETDSLWNLHTFKVDQKGVAPKTPYFARGRRNVTMVYNKTRFERQTIETSNQIGSILRSGVKQGLLRPKLSQRPGGVSKRSNLHDKAKNSKVGIPYLDRDIKRCFLQAKEVLIRQAAETMIVRKSLRSKPDQVGFKFRNVENLCFHRIFRLYTRKRSLKKMQGEMKRGERRRKQGQGENLTC